ncbi:hypothetical protein Nmel_007159 [Mimus melanotis]
MSLCKGRAGACAAGAGGGGGPGGGTGAAGSAEPVGTTWGKSGVAVGSTGLGLPPFPYVREAERRISAAPPGSWGPPGNSQASANL